MVIRNLPPRLATGAFIVHSGIEKWSGGEEVAAGIHGMASGAYPFLANVPPAAFLKSLSVAEITIGALLLTPTVAPVTAGAALTGFSAGLLGLYARTPGMRKEGSIWPTQGGTAIAKDVWMLGIGLGLLLQGRRKKG